MWGSCSQSTKRRQPFSHLNTSTLIVSLDQQWRKKIQWEVLFPPCKTWQTWLAWKCRRRTYKKRRKQSKSFKIKQNERKEKVTKRMRQRPPIKQIANSVTFFIFQNKKKSNPKKKKASDSLNRVIFTWVNVSFNIPPHDSSSCILQRFFKSSIFPFFFPTLSSPTSFPEFFNFARIKKKKNRNSFKLNLLIFFNLSSSFVFCPSSD